MAEPRAIVHIDMDAFFASVEQRDNAELRGKPVLVGGRSRRGVVAAASYEARRFGVRSAMPMVEALRRCPQAVVVPPNMARYAEVSRQVFAIFRRFTPLVEGLSLDEAFLDVTQSLAAFGSPEQIARDIRSEIQQRTGLTASAGVASNKFVAKIASDLNKPNGQFMVGDDVAAFLAPLPIEKVWGVGRKAAGKLHAEGIDTIGDIARADLRLLNRLLGRHGYRVWHMANGHDDRPVIAERERKSIGSESTYETDLRRLQEIEAVLLGHASRVEQRLTKAELLASTVCVKLKYGDFRLLSRQRKLCTPTADSRVLAEVGRELLAEFPRRGLGVRLVGLAATGLVLEPAQQELFTQEELRAASRQNARVSYDCQNS